MKYIALFLTVFFIGCQQPNKERLECIDNNLYSVHPQKVELMLQDSCDSGKIRMK